MLFIVIPFLNEAANLRRLAIELQQFIEQAKIVQGYQIILVDDGSQDHSIIEVQNNFKNLNYRLLRHEKNLGPGAAFQTAFSEILKIVSRADYILTMEADNTSNLSIVPRMIRRSEEEEQDIVLASPYMYGGTIVNTSLIRRLLSFFANLLLRELLGLKGIFTISSFFRLYKGSVLLQIARIYNHTLIERSGFEGKVELLMKCVFCNQSISEVPLVLDTSRRQGKSKMKIVKTTCSLLSLYFEKMRWKEQAASY